jgi:hypothetical protein
MPLIESNKNLIKNKITLFQKLKIASCLRILIKNKYIFLGSLKIKNALRAFTNNHQKIAFNKRRLKRVILNLFRVKKNCNN